MILASLSYPDNGRKCRHFITGLIKSQMVASIQRINYVKSYHLEEGEIKTANEKILLLTLDTKNKEKVIGYIKKNHPQNTPNLIRMKPEDIDQKHLEWIKSKK